MQELQAEIGRLQSILHEKVCGDVRQSISLPVDEGNVRHRCSACLRDFSSRGSCVVHIGNYHSKGGSGEFVPQAYPIRKD